MHKLYPLKTRILAISLSPHGAAFAALEGHQWLLDRGIKAGKDKSIAGSLARIKYLMNRYKPDVLILHSPTGVQSTNNKREIIKQTTRFAKQEKIKVEKFTTEQVKTAVLKDGKANNHILALFVARKFPEELEDKMPPKRTLITRENYQSHIFGTIALALALKLES